MYVCIIRMYVCMYDTYVCMYVCVCVCVCVYIYIGCTCLQQSLLRFGRRGLASSSVDVSHAREKSLTKRESNRGGTSVWAFIGPFLVIQELSWQKRRTNCKIKAGEKLFLQMASDKTSDARLGSRLFCRQRPTHCHMSLAATSKKCVKWVQQ